MRDTSPVMHNVGMGYLVVTTTLSSSSITHEGLSYWRGAVAAVVPPMLTSRPHHRVTVSPLVARSLVLRNGLVRRGSGNNPEE